MNLKMYYKHIENAIELDERLFRITKHCKYTGLVKKLKELTAITGKEMIGTPLVQPYLGFAIKYVALPKEIYWEMRQDLREGKYKVYPEIGICYSIDDSMVKEQLPKLKPSKYASKILEIIESSRKKAKDKAA